MIGGIIVGLLFAAIVFYLIGLTAYIGKIEEKLKIVEMVLSKTGENLKHEPKSNN